MSTRFNCYSLTIFWYTLYVIHHVASILISAPILVGNDADRVYAIPSYFISYNLTSIPIFMFVYALAIHREFQWYVQFHICLVAISYWTISWKSAELLHYISLGVALPLSLLSSLAAMLFAALYAKSYIEENKF